MSAGLENPSVWAAVIGIKEWSAELMGVGIKEWRVSFCVQQRMYVGFSYGQAWHG